MAKECTDTINNKTRKTSHDVKTFNKLQSIKTVNTEEKTTASNKRKADEAITPIKLANVSNTFNGNESAAETAGPQRPTLRSSSKKSKTESMNESV